MVAIEQLKSWFDRHLVLTFSLVAQLLSVLQFLCTYCSDQLVEVHRIKIPTLQNFPTYFILFLVFSVYSIVNRRTLNVESVRSNWYKYFIFALFDVEANYAILIAFQYTTPASIQLLDASSIPIVILLSIIFLRSSFRLSQYIGALITVAGAVALVFIDVRSDFSQFTQGKKPLLGDMLVLLACSLYAASNVITESLTATSNIGELLFFHGLFSTVIVIIQGGILEFNTLMNIKWNTPSVMLIVTYTFVLMMFCLLLPLVIKHIKASGLNVSLVTADIYTIIYHATSYNNLTPLYAIGAITVTVGCILFNAQTLYIEFKNAKTITVNSEDVSQPPPSYEFNENV